MFVVALRNIIGYAAQILPCTVLCLAPFTGKLQEKKRSVFQAALILICGLIPFLLVGCGMLPPWLDGFRLLIQNIVFLAVVTCLFALFIRDVQAPIERKVFIVLLVMCYGAIVTQANDALVTLLHIDAGSDGYMYPPVKLASLCAVNATLLVPSIPFMRQIGDTLDTLGDDRLIRRISVIPTGLLIVLVAVGWLPTAWFSDEQVYWLTLLALFAFAGVLLLLMMRTVRDATRDHADRKNLEEALRQSERQREELASQLHARTAEGKHEHKGGGEPNDHHLSRLGVHKLFCRRNPLCGIRQPLARHLPGRWQHNQPERTACNHCRAPSERPVHLLPPLLRGQPRARALRIAQGPDPRFRPAPAHRPQPLRRGARSRFSTIAKTKDAKKTFSLIK